jgi:putative sugar O-methyltransferase
MADLGKIRTPEFPFDGKMLESVEEAPDNELALVSKLMASHAAAKVHQKTVPQPYLPGAGWKQVLNNRWAGCNEAIARQDVNFVAALLRNFFRNEAISGLWGPHPMFENFSNPDQAISLRRARMMRDEFTVWRAALPQLPLAVLEAPHVGNPWGYTIDGKLMYEPVFEYNYQANYFARLLSDVSAPVVLEIGGGFGGLGYHIIKAIPRAKYIAFDLPENAFVQSYYLSCAFPERKTLTYSPRMKEITSKVIANYDTIVLPNFMIPQVESAAVDLVANVRSLSEMPMETISEYFQQIDRFCSCFFFHENIFKPRLDGRFGIPASEFPSLENFTLVAESDSRWPKFDHTRAYPCREYLYMHRSHLRRL